MGLRRACTKRRAFNQMRTALVLGTGLLSAAPALAQHTEDNAVESAEDAFGTAVGHEQIGIYDEGNVRGFSPGNAGNFRMEGMYFDIQGSLGNRVIDGETIRVGPASQGYAFPAPTGIVDLTLRKADDKLNVSPLVSTDSFGTIGAEVDAQVPLAGKQLGLAAGVGIYDNQYANGGGSQRFNLGGVLRWRPRPQVELLAFANHEAFTGETAQALYIPTGNFLPARIERAKFIGPDFARTDSQSNTFGLVGHANLGDWTLRTGLFHSRYSQGIGYANLVFVNPDMSTDRQVFARPGNDSASWSGEGRISRRFREGPRQHLITLSLRGRSINGTYGGGETVDLGEAGLNEEIHVPKPDLIFGDLTDDHTRQVTGGASYSLAWRGLGEFTLGLTRTHYEKRVAVPGLPVARGVSDATLPYLSAASRLTDTLSLYGSYVRGLEDAGTAPGFASNANQVLPAIRTEQYDFGLRWSPVKDATLILGYFSIAKPYIDLDNANHYGELGDETHHGFEVSLTANPTSNLRIVAGGVFQHPRVTAAPTIAQPVGRRPVGQNDARTRFNINWTLPFAKAVTLDAYVNHDSSAAGTVDNAVTTPASTRFGFGFRYKFTLAGKPFTARAILYNIADTYVLVPVGSGVYVYNTRRNLNFYLTADF